MKITTKTLKLKNFVDSNGVEHSFGFPAYSALYSEALMLVSKTYDESYQDSLTYENCYTVTTVLGLRRVGRKGWEIVTTYPAPNTFDGRKRMLKQYDSFEEAQAAFTRKVKRTVPAEIYNPWLTAVFNN